MHSFLTKLCRPHTENERTTSPNTWASHQEACVPFGRTQSQTWGQFSTGSISSAIRNYTNCLSADMECLVRSMTVWRCGGGKGCRCDTGIMTKRYLHLHWYLVYFYGLFTLSCLQLCSRRQLDKRRVLSRLQLCSHRRRGLIETG